MNKLAAVIEIDTGFLYLIAFAIQFTSGRLHDVRLPCVVHGYTQFYNFKLVMLLTVNTQLRSGMHAKIVTLFNVGCVIPISIFPFAPSMVLALPLHLFSKYMYIII